MGHTVTEADGILAEFLCLRCTKDKPSNKRTLTEKRIKAWHHFVTVRDLEKLVGRLQRRCQEQRMGLPSINPNSTSLHTAKGPFLKPAFITRAVQT